MAMTYAAPSRGLMQKAANADPEEGSREEAVSLSGANADPRDDDGLNEMVMAPCSRLPPTVPGRDAAPRLAGIRSSHIRQRARSWGRH